MRWRRARRAALQAVVASAEANDGRTSFWPRLSPSTATAPSQGLREQPEAGYWLLRILSYGASARRSARGVGAASDPLRVRNMDGPARGEPALKLERAGCPVAAHGAAACDYWREAISGLVLGMSGLLHGRHASLGHKDPSCVDVFS